MMNCTDWRGLMLKELIDKGNELDREGKLIPIGYNEYSSSPIRIVVHIFPDKDLEDSIMVSEYSSNENRPRPKLSRSSGVKPYPLADESGYVFGIERVNEDKIDKKAAEKHEKYIKLLSKLLSSDSITDPLLLEAIKYIIDNLDYIKHIVEKSAIGKKLLNKDWVAFVYEKGELEGKYLFEHIEIKAFWKEFVKQDLCLKQKNQCNICGNNDFLIRKVTSEFVYRGSSRPFTSVNKDAFVSYRYKNENASLGICLECAERISKALGYLINNNYIETIFNDKTAQGRVNMDSSRNLDAIFWIKEEAEISSMEEEISILDPILTPLKLTDRIKIETTEQLLNDFLNSPWTGIRSSLNINENEVYILIISPNGPGRIVIRDFVKASVDKIKTNLAIYFNALNITSINGEKGKPYTIQMLFEIMDTNDPNIVKSLVRTAYLGELPAYAILHSAVRRFCVQVMQSDKKEGKYDNKIYVEELLASTIKLYLTYRKGGDELMEELIERRRDPAYQSGKLLAILEEIQKRAISRDMSATVTKRYFGGAIAAPKVVLAMLVEMATKAHMPKIEREKRGYKEVESLLEDTLSLIDDLGGFPDTLSIEKQGEFILGYYQQKAKLSKEREEYFKSKGVNLNG